MPKILVPTEFKTHIIEQVLESVTEPANTVYYAFIGDHVAKGSTIEEVNPVVQTVRQTNVNSYRNMIIGKKMNEDDIVFMVNRHDWVEGTVYTMYDDEQQDIYDKNFYVTVDEVAYKHVYKCLFNNNGAPSTSKPLFKDAKYDADLFVSGDDYYETTDGYQWKYLYSIDSTLFSKFASEKFIPIQANTTIQENARSGAIDAIRVISAGKNYRNIKVGQFGNDDFNRITSTIISNYPGTAGMTEPALWYRISDAAQASNFYKNTILYITSGTGAGQYQSVTESRYVTGIGVVVKLEDQFIVLPDDTATYEITPEVRIIGNGGETIKATARAIINTEASNSIEKIQMLETGQDYSYAEARVLVGSAADENGGVSGLIIEPTEAVIRPILSPQGGHGANTSIELGSRRVGFHMKFNRGETELVAPENTFGQFGIVRDPLFANVAVFYEGSTGTYLQGETVSQLTIDTIAGTWSANTTVGNNVLMRDDGGEGNYVDFYLPGDDIFVSAGTDRILTKVSDGSNTTAIIVADDLPFLEAGLNTTIVPYNAKIEATAVISNTTPPLPASANSSTTAFLLNKVRPNFKVGSMIYASNTRNTANISGIDINSRIDDVSAAFTFNDFNQLMKIQGTTLDTFVTDELVVQSSTSVTGGQANAYIHSWDSTSLNVTRVSGDFESNGSEIIGDTSQAQFQSVPGDNLDIKYGDLDPNEGAIIYIQNDVPVERSANQSEEVRVILEF